MTQTVFVVTLVVLFALVCLLFWLQMRRASRDDAAWEDWGGRQ